MDLSTLRKSRGKSSIKDIQEVIAKQNSKKVEKEIDTRFWNVEKDEAGNGSAVIRFLPKHEKDELPWIRMFRHGFEGPSKKWYIENSLSTIGKVDPVGEKNSELWNSGIEANKEIARKQKRKLSYTCNVLIIRDPSNPENEGKVKLFSFGKKIFDMISDKIQPTFEDDTAVDVFDIWEGANFKLRVCKVAGYSNYDKSEFASPSELCDGDEEKILETLNNQHWLGEFIAPDKFKSYEELKKRFNEVMNSSGSGSTAESDALDRQFESKKEPKSSPVKEEKKIVEKKTTKVENDDDDDDMSMFKGIVEDDVPF